MERIKLTSPRVQRPLLLAAWIYGWLAKAGLAEKVLVMTEEGPKSIGQFTLAKMTGEIELLVDPEMGEAIQRTIEKAIETYDEDLFDVDGYLIKRR